MKKKITVRFVVERDFEFTPVGGNIGWMCIGDLMVMHGQDGGLEWIEEGNLFENPVSDFRWCRDGHWMGANLYELTNEPVSDMGLHAWLYDGEPEVPPVTEEEGN